MAMAAVSTLEAHISCSICFEVYRDPHALKCLHTFCLQCIHKLAQKRGIQCPECREFTKLEDIKKDFKTESLIELNNSQKQESATVTFSPSTSRSSKVCELCEDASKIAMFHCVLCEHLMCENCKKAHKKQKFTKNHKIICIKDGIKDLKSSLERIMHNLESMRPAVEKKTKDVDVIIRDIQKSQIQQLSQVRRWKNEIIQEINEHHSEVEETIRSANVGLIRSLENERQVYQETDTEIQIKLGFIADVLSGEDYVVLKETAESLNKTIKSYVQTIKQRLSKVDRNMKSATVAIKGENIKPNQLYCVAKNSSSSTSLLPTETTGVEIKGDKPLYSEVLVTQQSKRTAKKPRSHSAPGRKLYYKDTGWDMY